jgi:hypothetical protein
MWEQVRQVLDQSTMRVLTSLANFLPGLLALLVAVLFAFVVALIVCTMLRRSLQGIDFDRRVSQIGFEGLADWSPGRSPTQLVSRAAYWIIVVLGLLVGVSALDATLTSRLVMRLFEYLPDVMAAGLVLVVGVLLARFLARGVLISAVNMQLQSARLLSLGVKWLVMVLAGAMALEHLGIGGQIVRLAFGILFGGIVLALSLAVGLGSKDMVSRSWQRQAKPDEEREEEFHHL